MNKYLFLLASAAGLATVHPASAQYLPPTLGGTAIGPSYTAPSYAPPTYTGPGYSAPAAPTPGYAAPGYNWREQRANEDWRNNTWREQRANEDWRTNNWRQQRANEDWRQREEIAKQRNPNNVIDRGYVEPDQAAKAAAPQFSSSTTLFERSRNVLPSDATPADRNVLPSDTTTADPSAGRFAR
jgi:hypothetical protein